MTRRFYLHDATTTNTGTLPGASSVAGNPATGTAPNVTAAGASTNRSMDGTVGSSQVSASLTTLAQTTTQRNWMRRFLSAPLVAGSYGGSEIVTIHIGASEENAASNFSLEMRCGMWRPSTGALVWSRGVFTPMNGAVEPGTSQSVITGTAGINDPRTWLDGDVLLLEVWIQNVQSMASPYLNTVFYNGTTESSTTSMAAYFDAAKDLPLFGATGPAPVHLKGYADPSIKRQAVNRAATY